MIEFFVSKRYLRSKHKINFISIISLLSTAGVTIGVAALVIVLSVFNGFSSLVTSTLTEFDPHLRLVIRSQNAFKQIDSLTNVLNNLGDIRSFSPYAEGKAILLNNNIYEILDLKGLIRQKLIRPGVYRKRSCSENMI